MKVKVVTVGQIEEVKSRKKEGHLRKMDLVVADSTGSARLVL